MPYCTQEATEFAKPVPEARSCAILALNLQEAAGQEYVHHTFVNYAVPTGIHVSTTYEVKLYADR